MEVLAFFGVLLIAVVILLVVAFTSLAAAMALCIAVKTIKEKVKKEGGEK